MIAAETDKDCVRTRYTLIKGLLRRAFNGESRYTVPEMKEQIAIRLQRARDVPEGHKQILAVIREVENESREYRNMMKQAGLSEEELGTESRGLRNLTVRERMAGKQISYMFNETAKLFCAPVRPDLNPAPLILALPEPW